MRAILDACVLYPAPLRDLLMHLAVLDVFEARWTDEIHDEWMRSVLESRPDLTRRQLLRTRRLMDSHVRDCLVVGYEGVIEKFDLPDANDRHVVAAAIKCNADVIVTFNLRDFPKSVLGEFNLQAVSPDNFIESRFKDNCESICLGFSRQLESLKNPPKTKAELLDILRSQQLNKTTKLLSSCSE